MTLSENYIFCDFDKLYTVKGRQPVIVECTKINETKAKPVNSA